MGILVPRRWRSRMRDESSIADIWIPDQRIIIVVVHI